MALRPGRVGTLASLSSSSPAAIRSWSLGPSCAPAPGPPLVAALVAGRAGAWLPGLERRQKEFPKGRHLQGAAGTAAPGLGRPGREASGLSARPQPEGGSWLTPRGHWSLSTHQGGALPRTRGPAPRSYARARIDCPVEHKCNSTVCAFVHVQRRAKAGLQCEHTKRSLFLYYLLYYFP